MAIKLVGTIGAVSTGASGAAVTPAWGTGENRTRKNLLVCFIAVSGSASAPTVSGPNWNNSAAQNTSGAYIFYKSAAGADPAPTVGAVTGGTISAQLAEFSSVSNNGWILSNIGTTSPITATAGGVDVAAGTLVVMASNQTYSAGASKTLTLSGNNGFAVTQTDNAATSTTAHYAFGYGVTTGFASAQTAVITYTTTSITDCDIAAATFNSSGITSINFNNFQFVRDNTGGDTGYLGFTERIR